MSNQKRLLVLAALTASLAVAQTPPVVTKAFSPTTIAVNGISTIQFTITNPDAAVTLTSVSFTDTFPSGVQVASVPNVAGSCTAGSTGTVSFSLFVPTFVSFNGSLAAGGSCQFGIDVVGSTVGVKTNSVTVRDGVVGTGNTATAVLTVVGPATITKSFGAVAVPLGGTTTASFTITNPNPTSALSVSVSDTLPAGLLVSAPSVVTGSCLAFGSVTALVNSSAISASLILPGGISCSFTVNVTGTAEGTQVNTVTAISTLGETFTFSTTASASIFVGAALQISYAANLPIGESWIDITNTGASGSPVLGPGFGPVQGNICVNAYAFSADEQLISCCSCLVTPNGLANLGVNRNLTQNTLTQVVPSSAVIKLVASLAGGNGTGTSCNNTAATVTAAQLTAAGAAWSTTLHAVPGGSFTVTENPFRAATLSAGELASITGRCGAIIGNGSGHGICPTCQTGGMGAGQ